MPKKWVVTKAVRASELPAPARLVMFVLADCADVDTWEVPEKHTPSLTMLGRETGLDRRTVTRHLDQLVEDGWVIRTTPTREEMIRGGRNRYRLAVPGASPETSSSDLGAQDPYLGADSPQAPAPRGTEPTELGAQRHQARGTAPPLNKDSRSLPDQSDLPPTAGASAPRRPTGRPINPGDVVGAYVEGAKASGQPMPAEKLRNRVGKEAKTLLADKNQDPDLVLQAGFDAGRAGWHDLAVQMQRTAAERRSAQNGRNPPKVYRDPVDLNAYDDWGGPNE